MGGSQCPQAAWALLWGTEEIPDGLLAPAFWDGVEDLAACVGEPLSQGVPWGLLQAEGSISEGGV